MKDPREITRDQHLKTLALLHLAQTQYKKIQEMEQEICAVLELPEELQDFVSDAVYSDDNIKALLNRLSLKVKK